MKQTFSLQDLRSAGKVARALALVAMVLTAAVQAQEAGHWHELDDTYVECLLCKSGADARPPDTSACADPLWLATVTRELPAVSPVAIEILSFNARGPPTHS